MREDTMKYTSTNRSYIDADIDTVWDTITSAEFEHDFLPEVHRQPVSGYIHNQHRNTGRTAPSWMVPGQTAGWDNGAGIDIRLARQDLNVTIEAIEINLEERNGRVVVSIQVQYQKPIGKHFIKAHLAVQQLFAQKLNVLKGDLDTAGLEVGYA